MPVSEEERQRNLDRMAEVLREHGGPMYAGEIYERLGIGDGKTRRPASEALFRDAKRDPRFCKPEPRVASFALVEQASTRTRLGWGTTEVRRESAVLALDSDPATGKYHALGPGEHVGDVDVRRPTTACGMYFDPESAIAAAAVPSDRRCQAKGCRRWWREFDRRCRSGR